MATAEQMKAALDEMRKKNNVLSAENEELAAANAQLKAENEAFRQPMTIQDGENTIDVSAMVEELRAENEALKAQITDTIPVITGRNEELEQLLKDASERISAANKEVSTLKSARAEAAEVYPLQPYREGSTCSFYEHVGEDGFVYQERLSFRDDMGYDGSVVVSRALEAVKRGVGSDSADRMGARCENLPPFHKDRFVEVTIRIV